MAPLVTVEQGDLQGSVGTDFRGNSFFKFQGIPFAKPPIGELRFKAPVAPDKWTGVFDATKEGDTSKQSDPLKQFQVTGSEDCLTLNVFTKKLPDDDIRDLRPVMVWIHGGGLFFGSSKEEWYGPEFLITQDIVLVTINYRLGLLGFLSLVDSSLDVPGNAGFKDQVMALKWVQKNISKFGGDPNNVTIFGESAGGGSVHAHVLSPMSKGLFHKAIAQSGCVLNQWMRGARLGKDLRRVLNLEGVDDQTLLEELMKKSADELLEIQRKLQDDPDGVNQLTLGPVVENNSKEPFLSEKPLEIIRSGRFNQVPLMMGYTTGEFMIYHMFPTLVAIKELDFKTFVPWFFGHNASETEIVANKIKKFYFGEEEYSEKTVDKKYELTSDAHFVYAIYATVQNQYKISKSPIYFYRMSVVTELNIFKKLFGIKHPGVSHLDDVAYLFKTQLTPEIKPDSIEEICLTRMLKLWTNFAKFGNPTPEKDDPVLKAVWKPVTGPNCDILDIGRELVPMDKPDAERMAFWARLFEESPAGQK